MRTNRWNGTAVVIAALFSLFAVGCGGGVKGTYASNSGTMLLELRSGGNASLTMMGANRDCSYTTGGKNIHLKCSDLQTDFRIMDDGSLMSSQPFIAASFGALKKTK